MNGKAIKTSLSAPIQISWETMPSYTAQKMKFSIKDFFSKCDQMFPADLVTFTKEIPNGKLHFLCCDNNLNGRFSH